MRRAGWVAVAVALAGFSPFRAEERNVREGNERLAAGDPDAALRRYGDAEKSAGAHPEIDYDRGNALFRQGKSVQAREAWRRSQQEAPPALSSRASQNVGTALASEGDAEGAIAAFTEALRKDPKNEDARFDLEVLLRRREEAQRQQQQDQQQRNQQQRQDQQQRQQQQQQQGGQQQSRNPGAGERPQQPQAPRGGGQHQPDGGGAQARREGADGDGGSMSRQDAERILDAFRGQEKAVPPPAAKDRPWWRSDGDRDW